MPAQHQEKSKLAPTEYLELERRAVEIKHEFYHGEVFAMVGASRNHNYINVNLAGELRNRFKADKSSCKVASNDLRVKIEGNYTYPDIVIHCGDAEFEDAELDTLINPVAVIEILSDSTEAFDRGKKFEYYRAIPTLQEYILVSQYEFYVEQFTRRNDGKWEYASYKDADQILKMESVNCELPLSEIYWDVEITGSRSRPGSLQNRNERQTK